MELLHTRAMFYQKLMWLWLSMAIGLNDGQKNPYEVTWTYTLRQARCHSFCIARVSDVLLHTLITCQLLCIIDGIGQ